MALILDASIAIAFLDRSDDHHERAVEAIAGSRSEERILPASAYSELLVRAYRTGDHAVAAIDRLISDFVIRIHAIDAGTARRAAELRAAHASLRLPDALVIATAEVLNGTILTADRSWQKFSRRVRVI